MTTVIRKTGHFNNIDPAVIISSVSEAVALLMMAAKSILSKHPVLRITATLLSS